MGLTSKQYEYLRRKQQKDIQDGALQLPLGSPESVGGGDTYKHDPGPQHPVDAAEAREMYKGLDEISVGEDYEPPKVQSGQKLQSKTIPSKPLKKQEDKPILNPEAFNFPHPMSTMPEPEEVDQNEGNVKTQTDMISSPVVANRAPRIAHFPDPEEPAVNNERPASFNLFQKAMDEIRQKYETPQVGGKPGASGPPLKGVSVKRSQSGSSLDPEFVRYLMRKYNMDNEHLLDVLKSQNRATFLGANGRAWDTVGSAIAGVKPNSSIFDKEQEGATKYTDQAQENVKQTAGELQAAAKLAEQKRAHAESIALQREALKASKEGGNSKDDMYVERLSKRLEASGLSQLDQVIKNISEAIDVNGTSDIPGFGQTALVPEFALSEEGKRARQAYQQLKSIISEAKAGKTLTPLEEQNLLKELGKGYGRDDNQLRQGIKNAIRVLMSKKEGIKAAYRDPIVNQYAAQGGNVEIVNPDNLKFGKTYKRGDVVNGFRYVGPDGGNGANDDDWEDQ